MSLQRLEQIAPPPTNLVDAGTEQDWPEVERILGTTLPDDYKRLINAYGTGKFSQFLYVLNPFAQKTERNFWRIKNDILDAYRASRRQFPEDFPDPPFPELHGFLPWARTDNGNEIYWQTSGEPDQWPIIMFESRRGSLERYELAPTEFITGLLSGGIKSNIFPSPDRLMPYSPCFDPEK